MNTRSFHPYWALISVGALTALPIGVAMTVNQPRPESVFYESVGIATLVVVVFVCAVTFYLLVLRRPQTSWLQATLTGVLTIVGVAVLGQVAGIAITANLTLVAVGMILTGTLLALRTWFTPHAI